MQRAPDPSMQHMQGQPRANPVHPPFPHMQQVPQQPTTHPNPQAPLHPFPTGFAPAHSQGNLQNNVFPGHANSQQARYNQMLQGAANVRPRPNETFIGGASAGVPGFGGIQPMDASQQMQHLGVAGFRQNQLPSGANTGQAAGQGRIGNPGQTMISSYTHPHSGYGSQQPGLPFGHAAQGAGPSSQYPGVRNVSGPFPQLQRSASQSSIGTPGTNVHYSQGDTLMGNVTNHSNPIGGTGAVNVSQPSGMVGASSTAMSGFGQSINGGASIARQQSVIASSPPHQDGMVNPVMPPSTPFGARPQGEGMINQSHPNAPTPQTHQVHSNISAVESPMSISNGQYPVYDTPRTSATPIIPAQQTTFPSPRNPHIPQSRGPTGSPHHHSPHPGPPASSATYSSSVPSSTPRTQNPSTTPSHSPPTKINIQQFYPPTPTSTFPARNDMNPVPPPLADSRDAIQIQQEAAHQSSSYGRQIQQPQPQSTQPPNPQDGWQNHAPPDPARPPLPQKQQHQQGGQPPDLTQTPGDRLGNEEQVPAPLSMPHFRNPMQSAAEAQAAYRPLHPGAPGAHFSHGQPQQMPGQPGQTNSSGDPTPNTVPQQTPNHLKPQYHPTPADQHAQYPYRANPMTARPSLVGMAANANSNMLSTGGIVRTPMPGGMTQTGIGGIPASRPEDAALRFGVQPSGTSDAPVQAQAQQNGPTARPDGAPAGQGQIPHNLQQPQQQPVGSLGIPSHPLVGGGVQLVPPSAQPQQQPHQAGIGIGNLGQSGQQPPFTPQSGGIPPRPQPSLGPTGNSGPHPNFAGQRNLNGTQSAGMGIASAGGMQDSARQQSSQQTQQLQQPQQQHQTPQQGLQPSAQQPQTGAPITNGPPLQLPQTQQGRLSSAGQPPPQGVDNGQQRQQQTQSQQPQGQPSTLHQRQQTPVPTSQPTLSNSYAPWSQQQYPPGVDLNSRSQQQAQQSQQQHPLGQIPPSHPQLPSSTPTSAALGPGALLTNPLRLGAPPSYNPQLPNSVAQTDPRFWAQPRYVGQGQGVIRIMEFGSAMSGGYRRDLAYWQGIAKDFLLPDAKDVMSLTMWKDTESTSFVVTESTFPRFFMSYFNSGLLRVALNLGGVRETSQSAYEGKVNSEETSWVFTFTTGYVVTLRGPLFVDLVARPTDDSEKYSLRFRRIKFNTSQVDKHLDIKQILGARRDGDPFSPRFQHHSYLTNGSLEGGSSNVSVSSTPGEEVRDDDPSQTKLPGDKWILLEKCWIPPDPVNSYGFTKVTERTLDIAADLNVMTDLMDAAAGDVGPRRALIQAEERIRAEYPDAPPPRTMQRQSATQAEVQEPLLACEVPKAYSAAFGQSATPATNAPANPRASQVTQATPKLANRTTSGGNQNASPASTSSKRQGASPSASSPSSPQLSQTAVVKRKVDVGDEPMESPTSSAPPTRRARASTTATNASDDSGPAHGTRATNKRKPSPSTMRGARGPRKR